MRRLGEKWLVKENIYDVKMKNKNLYVLRTQHANGFESLDVKVAVIINLYYKEKVEWYMRYVNHLTDKIDVFIYSSQQEVLSMISELVKRKKICSYKENRGRDISALLVAAADVILEYDYICFLHDKSPNAEYLTNDVDIWVKQLWDNMIYSNEYVHELLQLFDNNKKLGMLVPPEPYGEYNSHWYGDTWYDNFEITKKVADELDITADISVEKPVFTLSSVFWARADALRPLFRKRWTYEDFQPEPLPMDGTVSHAIERLFGYVAQEAGYEVGTVMTTKYATELLLRAQEDMRQMFAQLSKREHVFNMHQVYNLDEREQMLTSFCQKYKNVYIYGAGNYGRNIREFLADRGGKIDGFIVSKASNQTEIDGKPIYEITSLSPTDDIGIIIAVSYETRVAIEETLAENGFMHSVYAY